MVQLGAYSGFDQPSTRDHDAPACVDPCRRRVSLRAARQIAAATHLSAVTNTVVDAIVTIADADRGRCVFFDAAAGAIWTQDDACTETAPVGLVGCVARSKREAHVACAHDDPGYVRAVDDPAGCGDEQLLAIPAIGTDGTVHAVLVAIRGRTRAAFDHADTAALRMLAGDVGPVLDLVVRTMEAQTELAASSMQLFREQALAGRGEVEGYGDVVRLSPRWVTWCYRGLGCLVLASVALLLVGTVDHYSFGPAIVRLVARTEVTSGVDGALATVEVAPGQRVQAMQVLARLDDTQPRQALGRARRQLEVQLRKHMLDPDDPAATEAVIALRAEIEEARAALTQREIRAPRAGVVHDLRLRAGQHVNAGETVMTIGENGGKLEVVALLPGADRPQLRPGMPMRLELRGYPFAYQALEVTHVEQEVVGPTEAQRHLGPRVADSIAADQPVVIVRAAMTASTFEAKGRRFRYHDGMRATAAVRVRAEPIVTTLFPALEWFTADGDG